MKEGKYFVFNMEKGIAVLTLNRPPYNIFEEGFYIELGEFEDYISGLTGIRALVINAQGKCFSAGIDLNYLEGVDSNVVLSKLPWLQKIYGFWQEQSYPVIAAIQGLCIGSGLEFVLGCDIRVAAENARFSLPEVMLGLSPDMGGTSRLTRLVGVGQAKRLLMTCDQIDAREAYDIGLVEKVVPEAELQNAAMEMAKKIARNPPAAVRFAKKGVNVTDEGGQYVGSLFEQAQSTYCCGTEDMRNALAAYKAHVLSKNKK